MANDKITDLVDIGTPDDLDVLEIVDVSDTTDSPEGTTKKVKRGELKTDVSGLMVKSSNLSDVTNVATARTNLDVYSSSQVDIALGLKQDLLIHTDYSSTSTVTGFSSFTEKSIIIIENQFSADIIFALNGVSNSTEVKFTIPFNALKTQYIKNALIKNNGTVLTGVGYITCTAGSNVVSVFNVNSAWTGAGDKYAFGQITILK